MTHMPEEFQNFSYQEKESVLCKILDARGKCLADASVAFRKNFK